MTTTDNHPSVAAKIVIWMTSIALALIFTSCAGDPGELAAKVNGTPITLEVLNMNVEAAKAQFAAQGRPVAEADEESFRSDILDKLISDVLLLDYAEENDYSVDDDSFENEMSNIEGQFSTRDEYLAALEEQGFTEERLRDEIRSGMTVDVMIEAEIIPEIAVTDEAIEEFYLENPEFFKKPESVTASHIIVTVTPEESDEAKRVAREKIEAIRQEIVDGADFADVAIAKSEGPSAPRGGTLGTFTRGQMVPPFEEAAFSLEPGELSDIVLTDFGYHIILVDEKFEDGVEALEDVSGQISRYLTTVAEQEKTTEFLEELKESATIEYYE